MARTQTTRGASPQAAGFAAGRGLLIVLFATAIGVLLLARAVDSDGGTATTDGSETAQPSAKPEDGGQDVATTVSAPTSTPATVAVAKPPAEVSVLVANGRQVPGAAKANADALAVAAYAVLQPTDFPSTATETKVYFTADYQADALAVATALAIQPSAVAELPTDLPLDTKSANVVVVLGTDNQGLAPS
ncbi:MAG: LytR C-terminal domain-containing protein [Acidimicrobiales bacterium]|nr:LytR C-terminal domain-containing protein [Acidimicrobiales bacterium]